MSPDPFTLGPKEEICIELVGRDWAALGKLGEISWFGIYGSLEIMWDLLCQVCRQDDLLSKVFGSASLRCQRSESSQLLLSSPSSLTEGSSCATATSYYCLQQLQPMLPMAETR